MAKTDWLPSSRETRAAMGKTWSSVFSGKKQELSIPETMITELEEAQGNLNGMLTTPKNQRTPAFTITIEREDKRLTAIMREIKKRFVYIPPLTLEDFATLGLKPKDTTPTAVGKPTGKANVNITYTASGALQANIKPIDENSSADKSNYGFRIYYGIFATGDVLPVSGKDLRESKFSRQKKVVFEFEPEDKGKTAFFCVRYENSKGEAGVWGDIASALIP